MGPQSKKIKHKATHYFAQDFVRHHVNHGSTRYERCCSKIPLLLISNAVVERKTCCGCPGCGARGSCARSADDGTWQGSVHGERRQTDHAARPRGCIEAGLLKPNTPWDVESIEKEMGEKGTDIREQKRLRRGLAGAAFFVAAQLRETALCKKKMTTGRKRGKTAFCPADLRGRGERSAGRAAPDGRFAGTSGAAS